jgi:hypothetical protein
MFPNSECGEFRYLAAMRVPISCGDEPLGQSLKYLFCARIGDTKTGAIVIRRNKT